MDGGLKPKGMGWGKERGSTGDSHGYTVSPSAVVFADLIEL